jgi:hypothetical protein
MVLVSKKLGTLVNNGDVLTVPADALAGLFQITVLVVYNATAAAGNAAVESAHTPDYAGTWASEATVTFSAAALVKAAHIQGCHMALRVRATANFTSGSADVYIVGMN